MLRLAVLSAVLFIGCAAPGVYLSGGHFAFEKLTLRSDGSFEYENWVDDGGTVCKAVGTWTEVGDSGTITTTVTDLEPQGTSSCYIQPVQSWRHTTRALRNPSGVVFRRVRQ